MNLRRGDYSVTQSGVTLQLHYKYNIQPNNLGILMSALKLNRRLLPVDGSLKSPTFFVPWARFASSKTHKSWSFSLIVTYVLCIVKGGLLHRH